jgi:hypothetical protein
MTAAISRASIIEALKVLGLNPAECEEVLIFQDKVVVRRRDIIMVDDTPSEHTHAHD